MIKKEIIELLRDRAMVGRMQVRDKQLMLKAADELEGQTEVITLYDRIKAMPLDEMVSFFVYLNSRSIIETADRVICRKCKEEHGGHCPMGDDDKCLYDMSDKDTIKLWLEGGAY